MATISGTEHRNFASICNSSAPTNKFACLYMDAQNVIEMLRVSKKVLSSEPPKEKGIGIDECWFTREEKPLPSMKNLIETYCVPPFRINIYSSKCGLTYYTSKFFGGSKDAETIRKAITLLEDEYPVPETLPTSLYEYMNWFTALISPYLAGLKSMREDMARFAAYEWIGLGRLYTVFEDSMVDEFFYDSPFSYPYVEHRRHGRCQIPFILSKREVDSLRTQAEIYGQQQATIQTPSIKSDLALERFKVRIGIDLQPVSVAGTSIHIRKVGADAFTLPKLIAENAITLEAASLILAAAYCRINVTILGPSGSGKTTLLNAIDLAMDPRLRRIYIEDAVESLDLSDYGYRQMKLRVQPLEAGNDSERNKMNEVLKSLHRSPDIVILGEIQDSLQCSALFQALESGVVGLQTFHSSSPEQAVRRWVNVMQVRPEQLNDLGILVTMKRPNQLMSGRIVSRISEVDESMQVRDLYRREEDSPLSMPSERLLKKAYDLTDAKFNSMIGKSLDLLLSAIEKRAYDLKDFAALVWKKVSSDVE